MKNMKTNNSDFGDLVGRPKGTARTNYGKREGGNKYRKMSFDPEYPNGILPEEKQVLFRAMCIKEEGMGMAKPPMG